MRKILVGLAAQLVMASVCYAGKPLVAEAPSNANGTAACTSISVSAWTSAIASPTAGRSGFYVTNRSTNTANILMILGGSSAPSTATNVEAIVLKPGITQYHGVSDVVYPWLRSLASSAEDACYQEVKQ